MSSGPITSWQIDGETMETVTDFLFLGSKITAGGDCSHELKKCLLLGRKVMTNLDSIFREGNGNPLQCSCLENPRDGGVSWASIYGVAQSWTPLKQLSSSSSRERDALCYFSQLTGQELVLSYPGGGLGGPPQPLARNDLGTEI